MDINNSVSNFQLENSRIVHFTIENDFAELPANGLENHLSIGNPNFKIFKKNDRLFCILQLQVNHETKYTDTEQILNVSLVVEGLFSFTEDNEDTFRQMLFLNGNSALYSIARAHILSMTSMSLISGRIVLPMINFLKLAEELKNQ